MRFFAVALIFFGVTASLAQTPEVPHKMHFADMTLTIRDDARREIQKDVDALTRHPKYFEIKAERARTYFPLISQIFAAENVPDDFKYLVLQESALVPDAVSVSNAVGFWQFKDFTALSMGLRVDKEIDERMNIASSTLGAARYFKKNNEQFDNWMIALQSYQMGAGGVKNLVGDKYNGKRHMDVNSNTYWYIKKYIAHKVAFENAVGEAPKLKAALYQSINKKSLVDLSKEVNIDVEVLKEYNKWVLKGIIPDDKSYVVVIPNGIIDQDFSVLNLSSISSSNASKAKPFAKAKQSILPEIKYINELRTIKALEDESIASLSSRAGITLASFLKFNEMEIDHRIEKGEFYFLERKRNLSSSNSHKVKLGDDLWSISQQYGIRLRKLKRWNQLDVGAQLPIGSIVWLSKQKLTNTPMTTPSVPQVTPITPVDTPIAPPIQLPSVPQQEIAVLEENETFNWDMATTTKDVIKRDSISQNIVGASAKQDTPQTIESQILPTEHIVQKGETLYAISKLYNISVVDIANRNSLSLQESLKVGQRLNLNPVETEQKVDILADSIVTTSIEAEIFHEVKGNDTLYAIARYYGVTIKDKKELTIKEGERLKIRRNARQ
jgi:membrane-bound lytic murein transglycosylase D